MATVQPTRARPAPAGLPTTPPEHAMTPPERVMGDGPQARINKALRVAEEYGTTPGAHHKQWVIDQMVRALTGYVQFIDDAHPGHEAEYRDWVAQYRDTYEWDEGSAP